MTHNATVNRRGDRNDPFEIADELLVLALVAARARNRAPVPWLVTRFKASARTREEVSPEVAGLLEAIFGAGFDPREAEPPEGQKREPEGAVLEAINRLDAAGAVQVERAGAQPRYISLARHAERKYLFRKTTAALMTTTRGKTRTIARIAEIAGKEERTVWRWIRGEFAPDSATLAVLISEAGKSSQVLFGLGGAILVQYLFLSLRLAKCGLSPGEARRATTWAREVLGQHMRLGSELETLVSGSGDLIFGDVPSNEKSRNIKSSGKEGNRA